MMKEGFIIEIFKTNLPRKFLLENNVSGKFGEDKCFVENDAYLLLFNGVVLNKHEFTKSSDLKWKDILIELYKKEGSCFYKVFRGSFSGILYDKAKDSWIIFNDHIGSKNIYYCALNDSFIFATSLESIFTLLKKKQHENILDINSAYMLLSYGYMLEGATLSKSVRKLLPGSYMKLEANNLKQTNYYSINNHPDNSITESAIIDKIDILFQAAVKRQFDKDEEYGYTHFVPLSGGLDTRLTCFIAHKLGYANQFNFTFSQPNSLDEKIPKQISEDLNHEWIFKSLANGLFLYNIEDVTRITGGSVIYYGLGHGLSLFKILNFESFGMMHSGQLGDVILGSYTQNDSHLENYSFKDGAYSTKLIEKVELSESLKTKYKNHEQFLFNQRGLSGINDGLLAVQQFTETMSPFYDVDLLNFAMTIPLKYRNKQRIYKKWMIQKHPETINYIWEKTGEKVNSPQISIKGKEITLNKLLTRTLVKLRLKKSGYSSKYTMNPIDYWLKTNPELRNFFQSYYEKNIDKVENIELKRDCENLFLTGNTIEKIQVLSLLSAIKMYF